MYTYEQRKAAVDAYYQYGERITYTCKKLGYPPSETSLRNWIKEFKENGDLRVGYKKRVWFTDQQIKEAIDFYKEHGESITYTIKSLGYPCRYTLQKWLIKYCPEYKPKQINTNCVQYSQKDKETAVKKLLNDNKTADEVAKECGVTRPTLYSWKTKILGGDEEYPRMAKKKKEPTIALSDENELKEEIVKLKKQAQELQDEVYKLQLEKDILTKAAELIKKDNGINIDLLTNKEKTIIIDALRNTYKLKELLISLKISKSSYEYNHKVLMSADKYYDLRNKIKELFIQNLRRYGYRRMHCLLKKENITVSEKVVRRIMKEDDLIVYRPKMKKYNSYEGEITPAVENLLKRDFHADEPYKKLLTDITEFHIPAGKVYLSPMIDCFDGLPINWTIGTSPNAELANTMLDETIKLVPDGKKPIIHSDRGSHYRWPGWIDRMNKAGFIRSMSKKGCSPDNSACEGFFGRLKNEFFYCRDWMNVTIEEFIHELDNYIHWYGKTRIKISLGGLSPIDYRKSLNL